MQASVICPRALHSRWRHERPRTSRRSRVGDLRRRWRFAPESWDRFLHFGEGRGRLGAVRREGGQLFAGLRSRGGRFLSRVADSSASTGCRRWSSRSRISRLVRVSRSSESLALQQLHHDGPNHCWSVARWSAGMFGWISAEPLRRLSLKPAAAKVVTGGHLRRQGFNRPARFCLWNDPTTVPVSA